MKDGEESALPLGQKQGEPVYRRREGSKAMLKAMLKTMVMMRDVRERSRREVRQEAGVGYVLFGGRQAADQVPGPEAGGHLGSWKGQVRMVQARHLELNNTLY